MKVLIPLILSAIASTAFAIECDCEVRVYSPLNGSHRLPPNTLKVYDLEGYGSYKVKNQIACRNICLEEFEKDMPVERLSALLISYGQTLIDQRVQGFNCTGLTTLKFPVRVKARLGKMSLGNVADAIHIVTHEEICYN